jgi:DNA-binding Xre family transcriptional regulator
MPSTKKYQGLHDRVVARPGAEERLARLREETLAEIGLYELRRSRDISQIELAQRLQITQSAISKFENGGDLRLSTLRDYVEALGGRLELRAHFDDRTVLLSIGE